MFSSVLVPVDLAAADATRALAAAAHVAETNKATLHVLTVVPDFGMSIVGSYFEAGFEQKAIKEAGEKLRAFVSENLPGHLSAQTHVGHGPIYHEIIETADRLGCDVIVMAAHRPDLKDYLLGPNAARVLRHASQSVLVVR